MKNSNHQYPAQTGVYSVKVKNGRGWDIYNTARLQISVGQEYHEGEKFKATIDWARHRFKKVVVCVNDTLQRFNYLYQDGSSESDAFNKAEAAGREWVERNLSIIRSAQNFEIHRWEDWRRNPEFAYEYEHVQNLYNKDPYIKDMVNHEVLNFWKRRIVKDDGKVGYTFASFQKASTAYLLEEIAVFFLMFRRDEAADVYPGSVLLPCLLGQRYCHGLKYNLLGGRAFTRIDFARNVSVNLDERISV